jgi:hypothetical protein
VLEPVVQTTDRAVQVRQRIVQVAQRVAQTAQHAFQLVDRDVGVHRRLGERLDPLPRPAITGAFVCHADHYCGRWNLADRISI